MSETPPRVNRTSIFSLVDCPGVNPIISRSPPKKSPYPEENVRRSSSQYHVNCAPLSNSLNPDSSTNCKVSKEQCSKMSPHTPKSSKDSKTSLNSSNKNSSFQFSASPSFQFASKIIKRNSFKENKTTCGLNILASEESSSNKSNVENVYNKATTPIKCESKLSRKESFKKISNKCDSKNEDSVSVKLTNEHNESMKLNKSLNSPKKSQQLLQSLSPSVCDKVTKECLDQQLVKTPTKEAGKLEETLLFEQELKKIPTKMMESVSESYLGHNVKKTSIKLSESLNQAENKTQSKIVEKHLETILIDSSSSKSKITDESLEEQATQVKITPNKSSATKCVSSQVTPKKSEKQDEIIFDNEVKNVCKKLGKPSFLVSLESIFSDVPFEWTQDQEDDDIDDDHVNDYEREEKEEKSEKEKQPVNIISTPKVDLSSKFETSLILNQSADASFFSYIVDSSKKCDKLFKTKNSIFEAKYSLGSRIVQICDEMFRSIQKINETPASDTTWLLSLFVKLESLKELIQCWLQPSPRPTTQKFEDNLIKLYTASRELSSHLSGAKESTTDLKRTSECALNKLIFLIGKRLLEVNTSLEESLWASLEETVADNLAKGSSTQFSIMLHSIIEQLSNSQMQVSSLAYQSFVEKKSESIKSLLEIATEFMDNMQKVMTTFKLWHETQNSDNTMTKCFELQFLWHLENCQYISMIHSFIINFTQNLSKAILEAGNSGDIHEAEKSLQGIETNLEGIQRSLPFSSSESELESELAECSNLASLESLIRSTITVIGKLHHLINTSFSCGKSILKKVATYYAKDLSGLILEDGKDELRRVHFSESIEST